MHISNKSMNVVKENANATSFTLITKCDGSSGHSTYKQAFFESQSSDNSVLMLLSMVLLVLKIKNTETIIWRNPHPASAKYCRPVKFEFAKETKEKVLTEVQLMRDDIILFLRKFV